jgi:hypothetical protein
MRGSNTLRAATWGRGLWETKLIGRENHPSIERVWINDAPNEFGPRAEIPQPVFCQVDYSGNLNRVYLRWSKGLPSLDSTINFSFINGHWESDRPLPEVQKDSAMYFKVFAVGSQGDSSETYLYMYRGRTRDYCPAQGRMGTGADWISEVKLADLQHSSGKSAYSDFTNHTAHLNHSQTYTIEVQLNHSFSKDSVYAWIDYDGNYHFGEEELIRLSPPDASHKSTAQLTTPFSVGTDTLRMRVRVQYDHPLPQSCGSIYGEVEDYSIVLQGSGIGLPNEIAAEGLQIYPNPVHELLHVLVPSRLDQLQMELVDLSAKRLRRWNCQKGENDLSLEGINPGTYILLWNDGTERKSFKLIVE